jgi:hypothetical protein
MKTGFFTKNNLLVLALSSVMAGGVYADVPALTVSNNQILCGDEVKGFAGNTLLPSNTGSGQEKMYNTSVVKWLKDNWKSTIIRAVLSADDDSYVENNEASIERIETVVDAAIDNDMYAIIDFSCQNIENNISEAIAFFEQMAQNYGSFNNVIYEIDCEPSLLGWNDAFKPFAEEVISAIRSIDPDNLIIVGTPNGSQDVDIASQDPIMGDNIAYALHIYAGTQDQNLRDKALMAMNNGIPLMVTQWGTANTNDSGTVNKSSSNEWLTFFKAHNLTHLNLAVDKLSIDKIDVNDLIGEIGDVGLDEDSLIDAVTDLTESIVNVDVDVDVDVDPETDVDVDVDLESIDTIEDLTEQLINVGVGVIDTTKVGVDVSVNNLIDIFDVLNQVNVDVSVNVDTDTDVDVDVGMDAGSLIGTEDQDGLLDKITSDDLVDAVDLIMNSGLDSAANLILSTDPTSAIDLITNSDLHDMVDQIDLNSTNTDICNNSSLCLIDETALIELIEQVQMENQTDLLFDAIDLIKMIDKIQSGNLVGVSSNSVTDLIKITGQGRSKNPITNLNDAIDLIAMVGDVEAANLLDQDDLAFLIASIALLIQNDTLEPALPDVSFITDPFNNLFDQAITGGLWGNSVGTGRAI